jgi:hypothetical protein
LVGASRSGSLVADIGCIRDGFEGRVREEKGPVEISAGVELSPSLPVGVRLVELSCVRAFFVDRLKRSGMTFPKSLIH